MLSNTAVLTNELQKFLESLEEEEWVRRRDRKLLAARPHAYFFLSLKILTGRKWKFCYSARFFPGRKNFFNKAA